MSKFKTYCRIIDYLDATDPDLAQLVRGTCVDMTLGSTKGKNGITLLIPDKEYRAKIAKLAYSSDPNEASQACDLLNALILRDVFKSGAEFLAKRANIPNSLYPSQHVGVAKTSGNTVTFESGAVATLDTNFADSSKKKNLAVWNLKGEIPVTTDKPAKIERKPMGRGLKGGKAKGGKHGGYDESIADGLAKNLRWKIAVAVENEYALNLMQRQLGRGSDNPFVRCAMSLVEYLHEKDRATLERALPLLSVSIADFYFLVEPHKGGDYLVPNALIEEWWAGRASHSTAAGCKILDDMLTKEKNGEKLPEIDRIRKEVLSQCRDRNCIDAIDNAYKSKYGEAASDKLLQDELRFLIHCSFEELESAPFDSKNLGDAVNMIGEYMHKMNGTKEERLAGNKLLNPKALKYAIAPSEKIEAVKCFVNSTYFMFVPLSAAEAKAVPKSHTLTPSPDVKGVWNITSKNIEKYATHARLTSGNDKLEAILKEVGGDLAERIRTEVARMTAAK